jgi:hypothetical protein
MANAYLTDDVISLEALSILENELVAGKACERKYEALFGKHGGSNRSDTIRVRKPNQYTVRTGRTYAAQDITLTITYRSRSTRRSAWIPSSTPTN